MSYPYYLHFSQVKALSYDTYAVSASALLDRRHKTIQPDWTLYNRCNQSRDHEAHSLGFMQVINGIACLGLVPPAHAS